MRDSQLVAGGDEGQREARQAEGEILRSKGLLVAVGKGKVLRVRAVSERGIRMRQRGHLRRRAQGPRGEHAQPHHERTALDPQGGEMHAQAAELRTTNERRTTWRLCCG